MGSDAEQRNCTVFCSLSDHHEESHDAGTGRSARKVRVPFWHRGHRVISMPVSWSGCSGRGSRGHGWEIRKGFWHRRSRVFSGKSSDFLKAISHSAPTWAIRLVPSPIGPPEQSRGVLISLRDARQHRKRAARRSGQRSSRRGVRSPVP